MECPEDSLVIPRPMVFHENDFVMPFLKKTYNMVDDPSTDAIVSWSSTHNSFIVWDLQKLSDDLLPKYFKHRNFASFTRQLNTYGFRKTDCERWEFANECFLKGQKHLLRNIKRKSNPHLQQQHQARDQQEGQHIDMNQHQQEGKQKAKQQKMEREPKGSKSHEDLQQFELKQLKRDRDMNVIEIFNLKQQQEGIEQRLRDIERKQHQIMMLMARAIQNPTFSRNFSR